MIRGVVQPNWRVGDLSNDKGVEKLGGGCRNCGVGLVCGRLYTKNQISI